MLKLRKRWVNVKEKQKGLVSQRHEKAEDEDEGRVMAYKRADPEDGQRSPRKIS